MLTDDGFFPRGVRSLAASSPLRFSLPTGGIYGSFTAAPRNGPLSLQKRWRRFRSFRC
jgi:hypothetical protein